MNNTNSDQDKIYQCILNINLQSINILKLREQVKQLQIPPFTPIYDDMMFYNIARICSILEELTILRSLCKQNELLKKIFYCLKPIVDYVFQYEKGFSTVRNSMVAHFQRDKMGKYRPYWERFEGLEFPRDNMEHEFIYDCLDVMRVVLIDKFPDFKNFHDESYKSMSSKVDDFKKTFKAKPAIEISSIKSEVNARLAEKGFQNENDDLFEKLGPETT